MFDYVLNTLLQTTQTSVKIYVLSIVHNACVIKSQIFHSNKSRFFHISGRGIEDGSNKLGNINNIIS